jgi:tyrosine-protein phosphatase YwqE
MLSFFKKKKTPLIDNFPANFVDIHNHLIPGIDDGAKTLEESAVLIQKLQSYGIQQLVCTPHIMQGVYENTPEIIQTQLTKLKNHLNTLGGTPIQLKAAAEYLLDANFEQQLKQKNLLTIKDSKVLVELSYFNAPLNIYEVLFQIQIAGYQPILAHPERYNFYHKNKTAYQKLKNAGCLFQLNLLSLTPYYGKAVQQTAIQLLKDNLITYVGTDTHNLKHLNALEQIKDPAIVKLVMPLLENNVSLSI